MTPTPSSPAATAARRAAEEIVRTIDGELAAPFDQKEIDDIAAIILKHHAAPPAHGDGTGGGALLAALHKCYAATGEEAGDLDDFRALVDREAHTVEAVQAMRMEREELESVIAHTREASIAAMNEIRKAAGAPHASEDKSPMRAVDYVAKLKSDLAAATARADALGADKRRLDWLEGEDFLEDAHDHPFYKRQRLVGALLDDGAASVRAAIDAAMGEKPGQGRHGDKSA